MKVKNKYQYFYSKFNSLSFVVCVEISLCDVLTYVDHYISGI